LNHLTHKQQLMKKDNNKTSIDSNGNLINNVPAEKILTDLEKSGLKGPVHKVMERHYQTFGEEGKVFISNPLKEYRRENNTMLEYNEKGEKVLYDFLSSDNKHSTYYENGFEYKDYTYNKEHEIIGQSVRLYNADRTSYENIIYDGEMVMKSRNVWVFNENGHCTQIAEYNKDNKLNYIHNYIYEGGKNWIECKRTDVDGLVSSWSKQKLNIKGHVIEYINLEPDGKISKTTSYADKYDGEGNRIPEIVDDRYEKEIYEKTYQYDHHNNWIKEFNSYRGKPIDVVVKDILYYNEPTPKDLYNREVVFDILIKIIDEPIAEIKEEEEEENELNHFSSDLDAESVKWLADRMQSADGFCVSSYYALKNNEFPSALLYSSCYIDLIQLLKELKTGMNAKMIHESKSQTGGWGVYISRYTLVFPQHQGYMLYAYQINSKESYEYHVPEFITDDYERDDDIVYFGQLQLLHPTEISGNRDEKGIEAEIKKYIDKCTLEMIPEKPVIYMVEVEKGNFSLKSHPVKDDFEIADLEVSYGHGFSKFHQELMNRFRRENKGLVLFHGLPGTGKTFYIRHLLREMALSNKRVIYMPPNMVDHLVEPAFMTFLTQTVNGYSAQGYFCVLLIEDAEPLLITRATENRIQGITNLLNMTDGILNDMLKLQIICTFNVELKQLDPALLRPGRLIARKEFKALNELDANLLAQRLGINFRFRKPTTLSEIYAKLKDKNTIVHEDY